MPTDEMKTGTHSSTGAIPQPLSEPITHAPAPVSHRSLRKRLLLCGLGILVVALGLYFGIPWVAQALATESTDDAYVNGHVTFVAPRVSGQVVKVLVDDNNRVHQGDLIVQLDKEPYQIQLHLKEAAVATAKANLVVATDMVRGQVAMARSNRFKLLNTIEQVDNQIELLRANVAALDAAKARLARAKADYDRAKELKQPGAISKQDYDLSLQDFRVAETQVSQALETVYQNRVGLGLPARPEKGDDLTQVPDNLDQTFSAVRQAVATLQQSAAPLGVFPSSYDMTPKEVLAEFYKRDSKGDIDRIYTQLVNASPNIKQAEAKVQEAVNEQEQAELNLRYCDVRAEIDGVVTRRNVNPGNNVQAGQSLMAIRSLTEIWIDANFKETQLADLRIGQPVRLEADMYGAHHTFEGRISGFTMGTGSTLALLPAQNATGNFVKVVQRLPVRIELTNYDPDRDPLFTGLSVTPYVYIKKPPTGPDAGKVLQPYLPKEDKP